MCRSSTTLAGLPASITAARLTTGAIASWLVGHGQAETGPAIGLSMNRLIECLLCCTHFAWDGARTTRPRKVRLVFFSGIAGTVEFGPYVDHVGGWWQYAQEHPTKCYVLTFEDLIRDKPTAVAGVRRRVEAAVARRAKGCQDMWVVTVVGVRHALTYRNHFVVLDLLASAFGVSWH